FIVGTGPTLFQNFNSNCEYRLPAYLKDLDGDGLLDLACMQLDASGPCPARANTGPNYGVGFGNGGGFSIFSNAFDSGPVSIAGQTFNVGRTSLVEIDNGPELRVAQDYLDLDGDGISDRYTVNQPNDPQVHVVQWQVQDDAPPGLLYRINNGIGGTYTFH